MDRVSILKSLARVDGLGIEIGPSYNPLLPKRDGFNIETVDYIDKQGLIDKYKNTNNVDVSKIEDVDYPTNGRPLLEVIKRRHAYDYIVASHVIEHTPDIIDFFKACGELLKPDGSLVLAVPDKRYCFDMVQPLSTTGQILQAHLERHDRPRPGAVFDSIAYDVLRGGEKLAGRLTAARRSPSMRRLIPLMRC